MSDVYRAISDATRRQILDELVAQNDLTLFDICTRLVTRHSNSATRQAISQHLTVLEEAGLVHSRRVGRTKVHTVDTTPLKAIATRWPTE
ncbi:helix-turn-helix transcriptional regulator [Gordonia sp. TBRC 11910]|uniref:Helix-turn-helix transcriptional regulator n=1 Tax=Gordonia asplenii TaxID=2725283 RepID=A0A848KRU0_9ACTN|nr:metalloregulator ArsR/SmtB family transcription factor [Gordonia asplenii]NMO01406.1 helix-turn-helix transcriptional regulator [Gordonia asplenii]